jgi:hypothetical protein
LQSAQRRIYCPLHPQRKPFHPLSPANAEERAPSQASQEPAQSDWTLRGALKESWESDQSPVLSLDGRVYQTISTYLVNMKTPMTTTWGRIKILADKSAATHLQSPPLGGLSNRRRLILCSCSGESIRWYGRIVIAKDCSHWSKLTIQYSQESALQKQLVRQISPYLC